VSDIVGVILAGGRGTRMGALGEAYPKALLPVANEPLIGHHLALLRVLGVREAYVVLGHHGDALAHALGDGARYGLRLHYVHQKAPLGSANAVGAVRPHVHGPFLLLLGDYYFSATNPSRLVQRLREGAGAIAAKREPNRRLLAEACALEVGEDGRVLTIVEKPAVPRSSVKGCGFYALQPEAFDAIARTPRTALRDEYELTVSLELYVRSGNRLFAEEIIAWDANFTSPADVLECNTMWLAQEGRRELVAEGAQVDEGVYLEGAVVGDRARVLSGSRLKDVVVFAETRLEERVVLERALVTPQGVHVVKA